jgi:branched-chain amino acid transport system permease protein
MQAVGFPTYRYKLACFVLSGMGCGLAGVLEANFEMYVSPDMLFWTRSGELIFMVVLGGMGSLFGPVAGTAVYLLLSEFLSEMPGLKEHWHLVFGPFLVLVVLFARKGIDGLFEMRPQRRAAAEEATGD